MSDRLNMAIAGVGRIGATHIFAMSQAENVNLLAVVEPNEELGRKIASQYGCDYYKSISELAAREDIEAVNICVPEEYHLSAAEEAAKAGKHIMLEKPIAKSEAEAQKIIQVAEEHGVRLMIAHTCHFIGGYRKMKNEMDAGKLGQVCQVSIRRFAPRSSMDYVKGRVSILYYIGIHDLDAIQWVTGQKITSVFAKKVSMLSDGYGEDGVSILFGFENGGSGTMELGWNLPASYYGGMTRIDIVGEKGLLSYDMMAEGLYEFVERELPLSTTNGMLDGKMIGAFADQISHFADAVLHDKEFMVESQSVAYSVRVVEAIQRSMATGVCETV